MGGRAEAGRGTRVGLRRALPPVKFFNIIKRILSPTLRAAEYYKTYHEKIHFWSNSQKEAPIPLNSPPIPPPIHSTLHIFSTPWSYPTTPPQAQSYDDIQEWSLNRWNDVSTPSQLFTYMTQRNWIFPMYFNIPAFRFSTCVEALCMYVCMYVCM